MKVNIYELPDEKKLQDEIRLLLKANPNYNCSDVFTELEELRINNKIPDKFPLYCRNCWKVLIFNLTSKEAKYLTNKYKLSKSLVQNDNPELNLVVIYTKSKDKRDEVINQVKNDENLSKKIKTRYRFACRSIQNMFPEMFISAGMPNPKYLVSVS